MRKHVALIATASFSLGLLVALVSMGQAREPAAPNQARQPEVPWPEGITGKVPDNDNLVLPETPIPAMAIEPLRDVGEDVRKSHEKIAALMSPRMQAVPECRLQHFAWLRGRNDFEVRGWHGFIEDVKPVPGGFTVKLRTSPRVRSAYAASTTVLDYMYENYFVSKDGQVKLVSWVNPPGLGQESWIGD